MNWIGKPTCIICKGTGITNFAVCECVQTLSMDVCMQNRNYCDAGIDKLILELDKQLSMY